MQLYGGFTPSAENFEYVSKGLVGYRGTPQTVSTARKDWRVNNPLALVEASVSSTRYNATSGVWDYSGTNAQLLSSFLPSMSRVFVSGVPYAQISLGDAFVCDAPQANILHERLLALESDLFFESLDRTRIADVGSTLAEFTQLKGIFTQGTSLLLKLPRALGEDISLSSLILNLETLAQWWLTYSFQFKPLIELGMDLFGNAGKNTRAGTTFRIRSKIKEVNLLDYTRITQGGKVVWGAAVSPPYRCTSPPSYITGGGNSVLTKSDGETLYSYDSGAIGSGAPGVATTSCTVAAQLKMSWSITTDPYFMAVQLGLTPRAMGWEVLPFSFVIDWFSKVGEFLTRVDQVDSGTYVVTGANYALDLRYKARGSWGAYGEGRVKLRSSKMQPNGEIASGIGEFFATPTQLRYLPHDIAEGTLVKKFDSRFLNAVSLLTVLTSVVRRGRLVATELPLSSVERSRIFRALSKIGL
jgi:hypothetical protein